jgi:hypothetical protein
MYAAGEPNPSVALEERRAVRYAGGAFRGCRPGDSNPSSVRGKSPVPVRSGANGVGAAGVEPAWTFTLSAGYKPEGIRPGRAPRNRTWRYRCIRAAPSASWAVPGV